MSSSSERAPPGCYWTALPRRPGPVSGRTGARRKKVTKWTNRPFCNLFHPHFINRIRPLKKSPEIEGDVYLFFVINKLHKKYPDKTKKWFQYINQLSNP